MMRVVAYMHIAACTCTLSETKRFFAKMWFSSTGFFGHSRAMTKLWNLRLLYSLFAVQDFTSRL